MEGMHANSVPSVTCPRKVGSLVTLPRTWASAQSVGVWPTGSGPLPPSYADDIQGVDRSWAVTWIAKAPSLIPWLLL